jgi:two-component system, NtrC family, nitrogen regulation sensor histidine kinase NtrY
MVPPDRQRLNLETALLVLALVAVLPAGVTALLLLWLGEFGIETQWTLTVLIVGCWWGCAVAIRQRVVRPLQLLQNLLAALREGDFSVRGSRARHEDALGLVMREVNELGDTLHGQRLDALEASALLRTVMAEIDVAVFAFDDARRLRLVNREGERVLGLPAERLLGRSAEDAGLGAYLEGAAPRTVEVAFPGAAGRRELRRTGFRQDGRPHQLLVFADVSRALREEERQAWQRLIRVLGHEINNSLTPIRSIARSLRRRLTTRPGPRPPEDEAELVNGLGIIAGRSEALGRFMSSYAQLARLPRPRCRPMAVGPWVHRVAGLEERVPVQVLPGPPLTIDADGDQLDQLLINLVRNAADAALEAGGGGVRVGWRRANGAGQSPRLEVFVEDEGPGLADTANLFVPFFTTKPDGSGIGLALSRQIAEAHGGSLTLENRRDAPGCVARLVIPAHAGIQRPDTSGGFPLSRE